MGKRILVQRRGKGGSQYRARTKGKIAPAKYPFIRSNETRVGIVADIMHERGRGAPLAKVKLLERTFFVPAVSGIIKGREVSLGPASPVIQGNVLPLDNIQEGSTICNIELTFGDGGKIAKAPGTSALLFSKTPKGSIVRLRSGKTILLKGNCRATLGSISGGGRGEKPFLRAGPKTYLMRARGQLYPRVRGVAMTSVYHPFGGGRHQSPHKPTTTSRDAPPGRKVGHIAARQTGHGRRKRISRTYIEK